MIIMNIDYLISISNYQQSLSIDLNINFFIIIALFDI